MNQAFTYYNSYIIYMNKLIKNIRSEPFSGEDILHLCDYKTKILLYSDLKNFSSIDEVLSPYGSVVILYETRKNYGHWVCLVQHEDGLICFYDSYGLGVDEQFKFIKGPKHSYLTELLINSGYPVDVNRKRVQKFISDNNTCGRHVGFRVIMKDLHNDEYNRLISSTSMTPDDIVTYLTAFIK